LEHSANTGYVHPDYAASLSDYGNPRLLPRSRGWILERNIPDTLYKDAMGCYPIFSCPRWDYLAYDLDDLRDDVVCISLVADPFGHSDVSQLRRMFPDVCFPFKDHFVVDLSLSRESFVDSRHRRKASRALESVSVERCNEPSMLFADWIRLYANLIRRHAINGIARFSEHAFALQLRIPGVVVFRAVQAGATVGMNLWYVQDDRAYYHLGAYAEQGYDLNASFALFWVAIDYFKTMGLRYLSLGAGAGLTDGPSSGLNRFKKGWSTGTRSAYFCGRIFDNERYAEITAARGTSQTGFFPSYRATEHRREVRPA